MGKLGIVGNEYALHLNRRKYKNFADEEYRKKAIEIMFEFYDYMSEDMDIWPLFGTLLGIVRNGDLIPHDDDVDFGYLKKDESILVDKLDSIHGTNGFLVIRNEFSNLYSLAKDDVLIDLYEYEKLEHTPVLQQGHRSFYNLMHDELFPLKTIQFQGKELKCMSDPVKFFERYYGKDWKTPK
jgi:phosphorylcholine metabolism protein LicD